MLGENKRAEAEELEGALFNCNLERKKIKA